MSSASPTDSDASIEALVSRDRARREALVSADISALDELHHDKLFYRHPDCRTDTKATFLASFGSAQFVRIELKDWQPTIAGDTAVITTAETIVRRRDGVEVTNHVLALNVWTRVDGSCWRVLARQAVIDPQSRVAATK